MQTVEVRSFGRLLGVSCRGRIAGGEVRGGVRRAIGPFVGLLSAVGGGGHKMGWCGGVAGALGLAGKVL